MASSKSVCRDVYRLGIPLLSGAMIGATGVAVVLAACRICVYAGPERTKDAALDIVWIIFWTGLAEGLALAVGLLVYRRLNRRIVALQNELSDLTRAVLHDLKTPITHIRNAVDAATSGLKPAEDILPDILESCEAVSDVINANAEISRAYSDRGQTPPTVLDAAAVVRQCADLYGAIAEDKGVAFESTIPSNQVPCMIHRGQLQHLVNNLLDNAIKFTPSGGKVWLQLAADARQLTLTVSDTGCGIEADKLPRIFERFYRADNSRHTSGFGLGLALVQAIVSASRGRIDVRSTPGTGTTFALTLPLAPRSYG